MHISLNKANKIRNALEQLSFPVSYSVSLRTDMKEEEVQKLLNDASLKAGNILVKRTQRVHFLFLLRDLISKANYENNISTLITKIAKTNEDIRQTIQERTEVQRYFRLPDLDDFLADARYYLQIKENNPGEAKPPKKIEVSFLKEEDLVDIDKDISKLKKLLSDLQEERNTLNHKVTIELPKEMVEFLRENDLV